MHERVIIFITREILKSCFGVSYLLFLAMHQEEHEMYRTCSTNGDMINTYKILVERKSPPGRCRCESIIKTDLTETGSENVD
jgi:hypothetical protein